MQYFESVNDLRIVSPLQEQFILRILQTPKLFNNQYQRYRHIFLGLTKSLLIISLATVLPGSFVYSADNAVSETCGFGEVGDWSEEDIEDFCADKHIANCGPMSGGETSDGCFICECECDIGYAASDDKKACNQNASLSGNRPVSVLDLTGFVGSIVRGYEYATSKFQCFEQAKEASLENIDASLSCKRDNATLNSDHVTSSPLNYLTCHGNEPDVAMQVFEEHKRKCFDFKKGPPRKPMFDSCLDTFQNIALKECNNGPRQTSTSVSNQSELQFSIPVNVRASFGDRDSFTYHYDRSLGTDAACAGASAKVRQSIAAELHKCNKRVDSLYSNGGGTERSRYGNDEIFVIDPQLPNYELSTHEKASFLKGQIELEQLGMTNGGIISQQTQSLFARFMALDQSPTEDDIAYLERMKFLADLSNLYKEMQLADSDKMQLETIFTEMQVAFANFYSDMYAAIWQSRSNNPDKQALKEAYLRTSPAYLTERFISDFNPLERRLRSLDFYYDGISTWWRGPGVFSIISPMSIPIKPEGQFIDDAPEKLDTNDFIPFNPNSR